MGYAIAPGLNMPNVVIPNRALNSGGYQPNVDRPCLVQYTVRIDSEIAPAGGEEGLVELMSDAASTPTIVRSTARGGNTGTVVVGTAAVDSVEMTVSYLVPAGHYVRLITTNVAGTPTFTLTSQTEISL